jgi:2-polyprenyl-3-methyl-5-hydroxy-6-metoxy-1,4-benzoquinol methylase
MAQETCPICNSTTSAGLTSWHRRCLNCRYEKAHLTVSINDQAISSNIDEPARAAVLEALRRENFGQILRAISGYKPHGGKLLDVGAAHGWFLELVGTKFDALGLEPDRTIATETLARGGNIRIGYFPDAIAPTEMFDIIIFNDVIEHIPNIKQVIADCKTHLNQNGLLVINLPSSDGIFYRLGALLCRLGMPGFFNQMWQKDLPSPHLHYFNSKNLVQLLRNTGFNILCNKRLESVKFTGLYSRLTYANNQHPLFSTVLSYCVVTCMIPFLRILPSDIIYIVATPGTSPNN